MALPSLWYARGRPGNALDNAGLPRCTHPDNNSASRLFCPQQDGVWFFFFFKKTLSLSVSLFLSRVWVGVRVGSLSPTDRQQTGP